MYKHYGGINNFDNESIELVSKCLENAVKKEQEIPNLILECLNALTEKDFSLNSLRFNKKMRSAEDILKDYDLM